jgi:glycosyltransferase involved in cell wall biosynthesis
LEQGFSFNFALEEERAQVSSQSNSFRSVSSANLRPKAEGKFLYIGSEKLWLRGVTYGTFGLDANGNENYDPLTVQNDFAQIAVSGFNSVRTYTVPPRWVLDIAHRYGLRVMVGLPWEQHVAFLEDRKRTRSIEQRVREGVKACSGHPAILSYAIGNEIPAPIVRWYGPRRVERWLEHLHTVARNEDPQALFTYVNYPSTEYLEVPFADLVSFNVYLEQQRSLAAYLVRLQNIAGNRPLLVTEIGFDSFRNGPEQQARVLDWQVRTAFANGCAGAFVFAWTDEWHRGGYEITDWQFGLTDRNRRPKPALALVSKAFGEIPFQSQLKWPRVSVVVCSYNGSRTIRECCEGLLKLDYPNFEVIVVDDGSTDGTGEIAAEYGFRVIRTKNCGLSSARNTGLFAATGEIVAYIDDDAYPDPHWLTYVASTLLSTGNAGAGGPNIPPSGDGLIAECVANAPGGPVHVLLSDQVAEHIPGCNMAFWKEALVAVGGFDPCYRTAGDDVDLCWRLQQRGWTLGFSPAAVVWHHRRNSVRAYWKQQRGYGKAEALLERKWPEKYNRSGHLTWAGRLYGGSAKYTRKLGRIFHGLWGTSPFQSIYEVPNGRFASLPMVPEWSLAVCCLLLISALGIAWRPLLTAVPLVLVASTFSVFTCIRAASNATFSNAPKSRIGRFKLRTLTAFLCLIQPLARLRGRMEAGLTPWRRRGMQDCGVPFPHTVRIWSERWRSLPEWLQSLESALRSARAVVVRGGDFDNWDLEVRSGSLGAVRLRTAVEEHGAGRQLIRFRLIPRVSRTALLFAILFGFLSFGAYQDGVLWIAGILAVPAAWLVIRTAYDCAVGTGVILSNIESARKVEAEHVSSRPAQVSEVPRAELAVAVGQRSYRSLKPLDPPVYRADRLSVRRFHEDKFQ